MTTFLELVSRDLIGKWGNNLSNIVVVLPGKRATLFFDQQLYGAAGGPVWAPTYLTIDQLFMQFSPYEKCQPIKLACRLYTIYKEEMLKSGVGAEELMSLDSFYGWAEIMLSDFDDIDKHMVEARKLFMNARDLAELDDSDFLSDEQRRALEEFFSSLKVENQSTLRRHFLEIWNVMPQIYERLNQELKADGLGYAGAIYRGVAEDARHHQLSIPEGKHYVFVGFNVLDDVEEKLFQALQEAGCASFYWDYDRYYLSAPHEAGVFMRSNLKKFPNALPEELFDVLTTNGKKIRFIAATTDNAQVRYLPHWIDKKLTTPENETAIILCDEGLMRPLLSSIPGKNDAERAERAGIKRLPNELNITMGFPLTDTPVYGYLMALLDLQTYGWDAALGRFRASFLSRVTANPFWNGDEPTYQTDDPAMLEWLSAQMKRVSLRISSDKAPDEKMRQLYTESIFQCYCTLNQFRELLDDPDFRVLRTTLYRLMRRALSTISVPFHGEMTRGLQVMGLLEARNLDFRHIVMTSVEEGFLPKPADETSLIPYCLKSAFGLSTIERKTAVFAYYFYRTIQRAEDITLIYNDNSNGISQREQSRFLRQLRVESGLDIEVQRLEPTLRTERTTAIKVTKTPEVIEAMRKRFDKSLGATHDLSPSALASYLTCQLRFYYQNVACLSVPRQAEEEIDFRLLGTLFHDSAEMMYLHLPKTKNGSRAVTESDLQHLLKADYADMCNPGKKLPIYFAYIDLAFWVDCFFGAQYDAYTRREERDRLLNPILESTSHNEFIHKVIQLYSSAGGGVGGQLFSGLSIIIREVLGRMIKTLLRWDMNHTPFEVYGLEKSVHDTVSLNGMDLRVGGKIDRMDIVSLPDGTRQLRILDYKTGSPSKTKVKTLGDIFAEKEVGNSHYYLQTFLYCALMRGRQPLPVSPALYYVREALDEAYDPVLQLDGKPVDFNADTHHEFIEHLKDLLSDIFNPDEPFKQTEHPEDDCTFCDFRQLCNR